MNDGDVTVTLTYTEAEAREVARAIRYFDSNVTATYEDHDRMGLIQTAIRTALPPPKPDEPLGLGAVVVDASGRCWVRASNEDPEWRSATEIGTWNPWDDVYAVRVLAEGWSG